jgi:hypothetical protein
MSPERVAKRQGHRSHGAADEQGAILIAVLVMMIVGMILVGAILGFTRSSLGLSGVGVRRDQRSEAAEGAVKMAIARRKTIAPDQPCAATTTYTLGDQSAVVSCQRIVVPTRVPNGVYGLITTSLDPTVSALTSNRSLTIEGNIFLSGGRVDAAKVSTRHEFTLSSSSYDPLDLPERYRKGGQRGNCADARIVESVKSATSKAPAKVGCIDARWWQRAGLYDPAANTWWGVSLPPTPIDARTGPSYTVGGCTVYFPGRYSGGLTVSGGTNYFASGAYYFDGPVNFTGGTTVGGAGSTLGCTFDAEAMLNAQAPPNATVSGKGVQFILGGAATMSVTGNSTRLDLNVREPGTTDFGAGKNSGIVAATYNQWTSTLETPEIYVAEAEDIWKPVSTHSRPAPAGGPDLTYVAATVPNTANSLTIDIDDSSSVRIGGHVMLPGSGVSIRQRDDDAQIRLEFGVVAHHIAFDLNDTDGIWIGTPDKFVDITQIQFTATSGPTTARGVLEYNEYFDNSVRSFTVASE